MAKKSGTTRGAKKRPSSKRAGAGRRAAAPRGAKRKTAAAKTASGTGAGKLKKNKKKQQKTAKAKTVSARRKVVAKPRKAAAKPKAPVRTGKAKPKARARTTPIPRRGGTGREETLAQTPETGRTRRGLTNPMPTRRSTGTPAGAGTSKSPRLERARRQLRELDETVPSPPSSLDLDRRGPSAARSGRQHLEETKADHTETSPVMTGGDVDADWEDAYSVGDEAPGGDNPTPDQDRVDDIGKALGVTYEDNEELKASDKIADRDKHRWELDPASAEDYPDRD
jgi:hypothetical protein